MVLNSLKLDIQFDLNNANISGAYIARVQNFSQRYKSLSALTNAELTIHITAHTDTLGEPKHNEYLAEQRAESIKFLLLDQGIQATAILVINKSEKKPLLLKDDAYSHGLNRRVELTVHKNNVLVTDSTAPSIKSWEQAAPKLFAPH